jgi:hypothetical protein
MASVGPWRICPRRTGSTHNLRITVPRSVLIQYAKFFLITRIRVESTGMWLNENKNNNEKNKKLITALVPVDLKFMCIIMCVK